MPVKRLTPPIAKIRKKNMSTIIVSVRSDIAATIDFTINFSPGMLFTALSGLNTLNVLRLDNETPSSLLLYIIERYAETTMKKSMTLNGSFRYAPLPKIKPIPRIFSTISIV